MNADAAEVGNVMNGTGVVVRACDNSNSGHAGRTCRTLDGYGVYLVGVAVFPDQPLAVFRYAEHAREYMASTFGGGARIEPVSFASMKGHGLEALEDEVELARAGRGGKRGRRVAAPACVRGPLIAGNGDQGQLGREGVEAAKRDEMERLGAAWDLEKDAALGRAEGEVDEDDGEGEGEGEGEEGEDPTLAPNQDSGVRTPSPVRGFRSAVPGTYSGSLFERFVLHVRACGERGSTFAEFESSVLGLGDGEGGGVKMTEGARTWLRNRARATGLVVDSGMKRRIEGWARGGRAGVVYIAREVREAVSP